MIQEHIYLMNYSIKTDLKNSVFNVFLKPDSDVDERVLKLSLFQILGAAMEKALSSNIVFVLGQSRRFKLPDLSVLVGTYLFNTSVK